LEQYPSLSVQKSSYDENLRLLTDLYSLPKACLISDVIQHFEDCGIQYDPTYVYDDISKAVSHVHTSFKLHNEIMNNLPEYLGRHPRLGELLQKWRAAGKKLFLLTNSYYSFVDRGMQYLLEGQLKQMQHWTELFDIIVTSANKPDFFNKRNPFRILNPQTGRLQFHPIDELKKGVLYAGGNLVDFMVLTKWGLSGERVLYFGDHLFNDLKVPHRAEGWKTGVIIGELEKEVETQNTEKYRYMVAELMEIERLIRQSQFFATDEIKPVIQILKQNRNEIRSSLKHSFNKNFGSVFRTHRNATLFAFHLQRYADIYTSRLENFLDYPLNYAFFPDRAFLAHEAKIISRSNYTHPLVQPIAE